MAILIVDDESKTRDAIRSLLSHLGHKVILEAKSGEEGLKIAESEKSRIRMIIAEYEMPLMNGIEFLQQVNRIDSIHLAPFILTTSDLLRFQLKSYQNIYPRLDHCLVKPFRITALAESMKKAYNHRCNTRNRVLYIGKSPPPLLEQTLKKGSKLPSQLLHVQTCEDLQKVTINPLSEVHSWFFDVKKYTEAEKLQFKKLISLFKKTPFGVQTPVVCMSKDPFEIFHFRTTCQYYWHPTNILSDWQKILLRVQSHLFSSWELENTFRQIKIRMQNKEWKSAWKLNEKALKISSDHCGVQILAGDIQTALNRTESAIVYYQNAIRLNPTLPRPYIRALKLLSDNKNSLQSYAEEESLLRWMVDHATHYCPQNLDVLFAVSKTCLKLGKSEKAKPLLEKLLVKDPLHPEALHLLSELIQ